jgi:hypothetical protein
VGCNTHVYGNNTKNLPVQLSLSQTTNNAVFLNIFYVFSSTKSKNKRAEQVQTEGWEGGEGGKWLK